MSLTLTAWPIDESVNNTRNHASLAMSWLFDLPTELSASILTTWMGLREIVKLDAAFVLREHRRQLTHLSCPDGYINSLVMCNTTSSQAQFLQWIVYKQLFVLKVSVPSDADVRRRSMVRFFEHAGYNLECVEFHGRNTVNTGTVIDIIAAHCPALVKLSLCRWDRFNINSMERLFTVTHALRHLNFSGCRHLSADIMYMVANSCPELRFLSMQSCRYLTDEILCRMVERIPSLQHLEVGDTVVHDAGLRAVAANCPDLRTLKVNESTITDPALIVLAGKCTKLTNVDVSNCAFLSEFGLRALIDIPNNKLKALHLREKHFITDAFLVEIAAKCPNLTHISLSLCFILTDVGVLEFARLCKHLQCLEVSNCLHVTEVSGHALGAKLVRLY